jgi:hypothetical protein
MRAKPEGRERELCDQVAERVALGEPVDDTDHVAKCEQCRRTVAVAAELGSLRDDRDPGLGFSARIVAGAQHRLGVRRRRRIASGLAATVAACAAGVFAMARMQADDDDVAVRSVVTPDRPPVHTPATAPVVSAGPHPEDPYADPKTPPKLDTSPDPWDDTADDGGDRDVATLVELADTGTALGEHADWGRIEAPLAPYHKLVEGVTP